MQHYMINELNVQAENGSQITIKVLDIIDSEEFKKAFIIYTLSNDESNVFASILNESEFTYSLDTITNNNEIEYIRGEIERVINEETEESL